MRRGAEWGGFGMGDDLCDELRPQLLGQVVAHTGKHDETRPGHRPRCRPATVDLDERIIRAVEHKGRNCQRAQARRTVR
jgi:hypothetical protein